MSRYNHVTACADAETVQLLDRLARQNLCSVSAMVGTLIRDESARRGLAARWPELIPDDTGG